jgi:hypothetical protein
MPTASDTLVNPERALSGLRGLWELLFPGQILACYLHGSQADGQAGPTSDLDLLVAIKGGDQGGLVERLEEMIRCCSEISPIPIDAMVVDEPEFRDFGTALLPEEAVLIYGVDVRPELSYPPADLITAWRMHSAFATLAENYPPGEPIPMPLRPTEEQAKDEWLGFSSPPGDEPVPAPRRLLELVAGITQAVLAAKTGRLVHRKGTALATRYAEVVGGRWSEFVGDVFRLCRGEWWLAVPAGEEERRQLRRLCEQALEFGTEFVWSYRELLVGELRHPDPNRARLARLNIVRIPFPGQGQALQVGLAAASSR